MKIMLVILGVALLTGCPSAAPVPEQVYYLNPPESVGELGKFVGAWEGVWIGRFGHRLYVQEISSSSAKVITSFGWMALEGYFDIEDVCKESQGVVIGKDLVVNDNQDDMKMEITYRLNNDGTSIQAFGKFLPKGMAKPYEVQTIMHRDQNSK